MKRVKRVLAAAFFAGALIVPTPALAFHHVAVPADECAPEQAGEPGNNPTAFAAQRDRNPHFDPPLPPANSQGKGSPPTSCPAD
jgi:hypothetical protein